MKLKRIGRGAFTVIAVLFVVYLLAFLIYLIAGTASAKADTGVGPGIPLEGVGPGVALYNYGISGGAVVQDLPQEVLADRPNGVHCRKAKGRIETNNTIGIGLVWTDYSQGFCFKPRADYLCINTPNIGCGHLTWVGELEVNAHVENLGEATRWGSRGVQSHSTNWFTWFGNADGGHGEVKWVQYHRCFPVLFGCIAPQDINHFGKIVIWSNGHWKFYKTAA